ncbi:hypothetical protein FHS76_001077 [Ochrobactrum daejeonense]|uniref:Uncharacterized protein n=1 Tax=Brucella daejeonensis TaxID=659015 RepID=A0A7W9AV98_9HYPH|nr:hypothetical protein [Brucella daejeonensis]MBB5701228.1 hypothetical protein [Brucella daejeonensis]NKB79752.1 hypothetical protein [Brucella daejeonensis]
MFGRLGMYYPLYRASLDRQSRPDGDLDNEPIAIAVPEPGELGMLLRMSGVIAAVCIGVALVG